MNTNTPNQNTHFLFDGEKVIMSPDLSEVVKFLHEVEKETESFLSYEKRLDSIKSQHLETLDLVQLLSKKLKENSIDFKFTFSELPTTIGDKLRLDRPIRSEMIALFAHLETIFCLNLAYEYKQSDEVEIIKLARDEKNMKKFINTFCLNENNIWCQKNLERFKRISASDLRSLRNSLTHFYSVSKKLSVSFSTSFNLSSV